MPPLVATNEITPSGFTTRATPRNRGIVSGQNRTRMNMQLTT
jgi:hypothetical protein